MGLLLPSIIQALVYNCTILMETLGAAVQFMLSVLHASQILIHITQLHCEDAGGPRNSSECVGNGMHVYMVVVSPYAWTTRL